MSAAMLVAFLATLLAGSATVVGGLLALHPRMRTRGPLAAALAFAAGIMLVLSFVEILPHAHLSLGAAGVARPLAWVAVAFTLGCAAVVLLDRVVPVGLPARTDGTPGPWAGASGVRHSRTLLRSGMVLALVVTAHNLPEGLATFLAMLESPALGFSLVAAIAIHNVPEGMAVAAPIYAATGSRRRALAWAAVSGVAEPVGAVVGYLTLRALLPEQLVVLALAVVGGMMVTISLRSLLPTARRLQTRWSDTPLGFGVGAGVIGVSLLLL